MRLTRFAVFVSVLLSLTVAASAQEKKAEKKAPAKMEMPKPGPEVQKLAYFVGTWKSEGDLKENPFGMPPGKFSSTDKCDWFEGGYAVVCHSAGKGTMGATHGMGILGYNMEDKVYTYYGVDNMGYSGLSKGKIDGNFWVFSSEDKMMGKTFHSRYSMTTSPDSYKFKYETSEDGQKWTTVMEGKTTKAGAAKKEAAPAEKKS
jgi:hypothetical protein